MIVDLETPRRSAKRGGVWSYVSASRLNTWLACPRKFRLRYVEGVKTSPSPSMFVGKMTHTGLEVFYRHRQLGIAISASQVADRLRAQWDEQVAEEGVRFETTAEEQRLKQQALDLVSAYVEQTAVDEAHPTAVETALEVPLVDPVKGEDLGIPLVGVVDLVLDTVAGPVIIDFKTAARGGRVLEISNEVQLSCYAFAFRQMTGQREDELQIRRLIKNKTPRIETHRYPSRSPAHFQRLFTVIRAFLDDLHSGKYLYRPGFGCTMCEFGHSRCSL